MTEEITDVNDLSVVCGWDIGFSTPFFCATPTNNAMGLYMLNQISNDHDWERIVTEEALDLETGKSYQLSFDYYIARYPVEEIQVLLSTTPLLNMQFPTGGKIIAKIENPVFDAVSILDNNDCYPENAIFTHFAIASNTTEIIEDF